MPLSRTLSNGLVAVGIERAGSTALLAVDLRLGSRHESDADAGLTHFLEHMVFQGCSGWPSTEAVNLEAERIGGQLDGYVNRDSTRIEHKMHPGHLEDSARLIADLIGSPAFCDLETERAIVLEEALDEFDEDGRLVDIDTLSRRALWPKAPLGRSIIGDAKRIRRFGLEDLRRHHAETYGACNMIVTAVAPQPEEALLDLVEAHFGGLPGGTPNVPAPAPETPTGPKFLYLSDTSSQVHVCMLFRAPGGQDPDRAALAVLRMALDDGMASRMHRRLGAELGLAYSHWAEYEEYPDAAAFELGAQVSPKKVVELVREAQHLLSGLMTDPPAGEELERLRFRVRWAIRSMEDMPEGLVALHGSARLHLDPLPPLAERLADIEAVSSEDLARVARRVFTPKNYCFTAVGPGSKADRRGVRAAVQTYRLPS